MNEVWDAIEVAVPAHLTAVEVGRFIDAEVRIAANRAGEFVREVRIGVGLQPCGDWRRWSASYLPGYPTA